MPGERFHVRMASDYSGQEDRVAVEVSMDGFNIYSPDGGRILHKYPLHHISRWSMHGGRLILFIKSSADLEDQTVTLLGDERTICNVLDTLTCCCMQLAEMMQSGHDGASVEAANSLHSLLRKSKKQAQLPTADQVHFWSSPEKQGWMYSQGEHIRTWRKRWFVLKQGFLFRFSDPDVNSATKPRGIVDLSQVTDVTDGTNTTGRSNSVCLSTASGRNTCYICESETAQVEWISALEGSVARIVKIVAGVDDDSSPPTKSAPSRTAKPAANRTFDNNGMVNIVNYNSAPSSAAKRDSYVTIDYGTIGGAQRVPDHGYQQESTGYSSGNVQQGYQQYGGGPHATLLDVVTAPHAAAPPIPGNQWQVHFTADGRSYYYNPATQVTQWEAPNTL